MTDRIELAAMGDRWAVKHEGGYLGYVRSFEEGARVAGELIDWLRSHGRMAELIVGEARSFASRRPR